MNVSNRPASPVFAGRAEQLALLGEKLDSATGGSSATVLIGGEAGIGKSRLVAEFAGRSRAEPPLGAGARVLLGGCLELGVEGLPFAPFTAALRQAVRDLGADELAGLLPAGPRELARLLPDLGEPPAETENSRLRLFEHVRVLLGALTEPRPLALVVEDAHWADRSTRDLVTFLVHNLEGARVLLLVTYRSDELHRTHPLRPLLAELDRTDRVIRVELSRLTRREVGEQLAGILGRPPEPALVEEVYGRSAGNPLFVESLVDGDGALRAGLSDSLRDLLLAGVRRLPEETQRVLGAAAGAGNRVDDPLLAAVVGLDVDALADALRPAVDAHVLVPVEHGYAFRHALIREALSDDLLPGERTRLHLRYAEALQRDPSPTAGSTAELAHHWYAAHDAPRALAAAWSAAAEAKSALAYAEQLSMLERVLELWERVPDAAERIGSEHLAVLELAAAAARSSGAVDRGVMYANAVLEEIDEGAHPARAALALEGRGRMLRELGREAGMDDLRRAAKLLTAEPPSAARATVLASLAGALVIEPDYEEADALITEALDVAREVGDAATEASALLKLGCVRFERGDLEEALALDAEARAIAQRIGEPVIAACADNNEAAQYEMSGLHEQAIEAARRGMAYAAAHGLARTSGAFTAINLADSLTSLGRWDEAMEVARSAAELAPPPAHRAGLATVQGFIALARGDLAAAEAAVLATSAVFTSCYVSMQDQLPPIRLKAELRLAQGRPAEALDAVKTALRTYRTEITRTPHFSWPLLVVGAESSAAVRAADPRRADEADALLAELRAVAAVLRTATPVQRAQRATFLAEAGYEPGDTDEAGDWPAAVAAWEATDQPYPLARALLRATGAAASGDRDDAAGRLRRAAEIADRLGAVPLRRAADELARRGRLSLDGRPGEGQPDGAGPLTPREVEVLRLVAAGYSNRRIAGELFISVKTASVHVSNILAKLGVASRGEAAAVAHRDGLLR
ncbi:MAG: AAA family ATPase [Streptosporangiales bacterium]|nr:AAA family ATPase [Streptosporangiales bacterium]